MAHQLTVDARRREDCATSTLSEERPRNSDNQSDRYRPLPNLIELRPVSSRKLVLVVEDDTPMLGFLENVLRTENYDLFAVNGSQEALELVERGFVPDLLITDVQMPGLSGVELSRRLRAVVPTLPVLFETGHSASLFHECPELDAHTAFIEKPFSPRGLVEAARLVLFGTFNPG
jgi:CheY-like chemotaxis protein